MIISHSSFHAGTTVSKQLLIMLSFTAVAGCTTMPTVEEAALLDANTTALGLARGGVELNPLGPIGGVVVKILYITEVFGQRTVESDRFATAVWTGAAANNIVGVLTLTPVLSLAAGVAVGRYVYTVLEQSGR